MGLLLAVGLVAGCPDDDTTGEPAVQQEQPPAAPAPGTQTTPGGTTPPATNDRPGQIPPADEEPTMEDEAEEELDQEPAQPQR